MITRLRIITGISMVALGLSTSCCWLKNARTERTIRRLQDNSATLDSEVQSYMLKLVEREDKRRELYKINK